MQGIRCLLFQPKELFGLCDGIGDPEAGGGGGDAVGGIEPVGGVQVESSLEGEADVVGAPGEDGLVGDGGDPKLRPGHDDPEDVAASVGSAIRAGAIQVPVAALVKTGQWT